MYNGKFAIEGISIDELADRFGTPFYVYDASVIRKQLCGLRSALPDGFQVAYSVKANPSEAIIQLLLEEGCLLEIASVGEYHRSRAAGCQPEKILFAGPGKTEAELKEVLTKGIGEIHAESVRELERISRISKGLKIRTKVAIRVNPTAEARGGAMRMGGKPAPFGIDEEQLPLALDFVRESRQLEFRGIHLFAGTQILDHQTLIEQYRKGLEIASIASDYMSEPIRTLDFGGGLGIPYFESEQMLDLGELKLGLEELFENVRQRPAFAKTQFLVEPGRFLVGESGIYVTRIIDIKSSRGKKFAIMDGGMNHHLAASGNLGQVIKRNYPFGVLNKLGINPTEAVELVGPLCTPLDTLGRSAELPLLEVDDTIGGFSIGRLCPIGKSARISQSCCSSRGSCRKWEGRID